MKVTNEGTSKIELLDCKDEGKGLRAHTFITLNVTNTQIFCVHKILIVGFLGFYNPMFDYQCILVNFLVFDFLIYRLSIPSGFTIIDLYRHFIFYCDENDAALCINQKSNHGFPQPFALSKIRIRCTVFSCHFIHLFN